MNRTKRLCFLALVATLLIATTGAKNQYLICKSIDDVFGDMVIQHSNMQKSSRPFEKGNKGDRGLETDYNIQKGSVNSKQFTDEEFEALVRKRLNIELPAGVKQFASAPKIEENADVAPPVKEPVVEEKRILNATQYAIDLLKKHNKYRADHATDPMTLNIKLCQEAQKWAEHIALIDKLEHEDCRGSCKVGENLAWTETLISANGIVAAWYEENIDYDFSNPGFKETTGHFTQVVWKGSKEFGAGIAQTAKGGTYVVAQYLPPGNVGGQFEENVLPTT